MSKPSKADAVDALQRHVDGVGLPDPDQMASDIETRLETERQQP